MRLRQAVAAVVLLTTALGCGAGEGAAPAEPSAAAASSPAAGDAKGAQRRGPAMRMPQPFLSTPTASEAPADWLSGTLVNYRHGDPSHWASIIPDDGSERIRVNDRHPGYMSPVNGERVVYLVLRVNEWTERATLVQRP